MDDPDRVFRVRKQMARMVQTAADIIATEFQELVAAWPSLDQSPLFDVAMIDACVGCDDYRKNLCNPAVGLKTSAQYRLSEREKDHPNRPYRFDARSPP